MTATDNTRRRDAVSLCARAAARPTRFRFPGAYSTDTRLTSTAEICLNVAMVAHVVTPAELRRLINCRVIIIIIYVILRKQSRTLLITLIAIIYQHTRT